MNEKMKTLEKVNKVLGENGITAKFAYPWKNNGPKEGIELRRAGCAVAPVIYPNEQWWEMSTEMMIDELKKVIEDSSVAFDSQAISEAMSREYVLSHVKPRIVSARNRVEMEARDIVVKPYAADLVAVFFEDFEALQGGTVKITNTILENAGIRVDELYQQALLNSRDDYQIRSMAAMLMEMMGLDAEDMPLQENATPQLYVVTNKDKLFGAAAILSEDLLSNIRNKFDSDFYILPSSVHEMIITPKTEAGPAADELLAMVSEINATQVEPEDRLTDNVYQYTLKKGLEALY